MPKRSSSKNPPADPVRAAFNVLQRIIDRTEAPVEPRPEKNPAAVALGRLGGLKGGKARAKALSKSKRSEIAKKAANARWNPKYKR